MPTIQARDAFGKIASAYSMAERISSYSIPEPNSGCLLWTGGVTKSGYGRLKVDGKTKRAHRLVWEQERGPIPENLCVCHACDTPLCVNIDHMFIGTQADNTADKMAKGRHFTRRGEKHGQSKLTELDVIAIRSAVGFLREIAERFGVTRETVRVIKSRRGWKHVL